MKSLVLALAVAFVATAAPATELLLGAGHSRYGSDRGRDSAVISAELRGAPFAQFAGAGVSAAVAADLHGRGDAFVGIGLAARWALGADWFIDTSVLPGLYSASGSANDLGGNFQFRSALALGRRFDGVGAVSLAVVHKSNAGIDSFNPGMNALLLRWHREF